MTKGFSLEKTTEDRGRDVEDPGSVLASEYQPQSDELHRKEHAEKVFNQKQEKVEEEIDDMFAESSPTLKKTAHVSGFNWKREQDSPLRFSNQLLSFELRIISLWQTIGMIRKDTTVDLFSVSSRL